MNPETAIRKRKHHSAGYHVQTVVAVLITIVMLFPLYWMLATSVKSAEEVPCSRTASIRKTILTF